MTMTQPVINMFGDSLSEIAMIAKLTTARWGGQKVDKKVSAKVNTEMQAAKDAGKYVKVLATKRDLAMVNHWYRKACTFHEKNTLPWNRTAEGILPTANFYRYENDFREIRASFLDAVEELIFRLPEIKRAAQIRLGDMFYEEEFPSRDDLRERFNLSVEFLPIPDPSDFRLNIGAEKLAKLRGKYVQNVEGTVEKAMLELWQRLYGQVQRIAETLSNPEQKFQATMLENAMEIVDLLPRLNLRQDNSLELMRVKVEKQLLVYEAEELRGNMSARMETAGAARDIAAEMEALKPQLRAIEF